MTRQAAIAKVGRQVHSANREQTAAHAMIEAIAAMLDVALGKPKSAVPKEPKTPLPYGPKEVFDLMELLVGDHIQLRPYDSATFGRLGKAMQRIQGLEHADNQRVVSWIQSGGLSGWPTQPTWNHVVRHYANWVSYARAWEAKGGSACQTTMLTGADWR